MGGAWAGRHQRSAKGEEVGAGGGRPLHLVHACHRDVARCPLPPPATEDQRHLHPAPSAKRPRYQASTFYSTDEEVPRNFSISTYHNVKSWRVALMASSSGWLRMLQGRSMMTAEIELSQTIMPVFWGASAPLYEHNISVPHMIS